MARLEAATAEQDGPRSDRGAPGRRRSDALRRALARRHVRHRRRRRASWTGSWPASARSSRGSRRSSSLLRDGVALAAPGDCAPLLALLDDPRATEETEFGATARAQRCAPDSRPASDAAHPSALRRRDLMERCGATRLRTAGEIDGPAAGAPGARRARRVSRAKALSPAALESALRDSARVDRTSRVVLGRGPRDVPPRRPAPSATVCTHVVLGATTVADGGGDRSREPTTTSDADQRDASTRFFDETRTGSLFGWEEGGRAAFGATGVRRSRHRKWRSWRGWRIPAGRRWR